MAKLPSKSVLENMKRVDLQRLCKDYGVKANLKSEALIDLLLHATCAAPRRTSTHLQQSGSTLISSRSGAKMRGGSGGSVIIYDTSNQNEEIDPSEGEVENNPELDSQPTPPLISRMRKAKETQTRLGVGKPVAAGGSGARIVTKSQSVSRGKRGSSSKNVKPTTIPEEDPESKPEPEPTVSSQIVDELVDTTEAMDTTTRASGSTFMQKHVQVISANSNSLVSLACIDEHVAAALRPLHEQIRSQKSELEQVQSLKTSLELLKSQMIDEGNLRQKVDSLASEVEGLRSQVALVTALEAEIEELKAHARLCVQHGAKTSNSNRPTTHKSPTDNTVNSFRFGTISFQSNDHSNPFESPGVQTMSSTSNTLELLPETALIILGKRRRDSVSSNVGGIDQEEKQGEFSEIELAKRVSRPTKKRIKICQGVDDADKGQEQIRIEEEEEEAEEEEKEQGHVQAMRVPSFNVRGGPDQRLDLGLADPPPTKHLLNFFPPPSPPGSGSSRHSTTISPALVSNNQHPFSFSFLPLSSTPAGPLYPSLPGFNYPELPQSPSPTAPIGGFTGSNNSKRTKTSQSSKILPPEQPWSRVVRGSGSSLGFGSPDSSHSTMSVLLDPAALTRQQSYQEHDSTSHEMATGTGLNKGSTVSGSSDTPQMKRTMYGTELDADTRFGDFGLDGVASGFWAGRRF